MSSFVLSPLVPVSVAGLSAASSAVWAGWTRRRSGVPSPMSWWRLSRAGDLPDGDALRAEAVIATSTMRGFGVVVASRTDRGVETFLGLSDPSDAPLVAGFARGLNGVADGVPGGVSWSAEAVFEAVVPVGDPHTGGSSNLGDVGTVAAALGGFLPQGAWVAMVFRRQSDRERGDLRRFYEVHPATAANARTHAALTEGGLVVSLCAGAGSAADAGTLLSAVTAGLHGFDIGVRAVPVGGCRVLFAAPAAAVAAGVATGAVGGSPWMVASAVSAGLLPSLALSSGAAKSAGGRRLAGLAAGAFPAPRSRWWPVRVRREEKDPAGNVTRGAVNPYPLSARSFPAGAGHPLMLAMPHSQSSAQVRTTQRRPTPAVLSDRIGVRVGVGVGDGNPVHLSWADRYGGILAVGVPGAGKTVLVHDVWVGDLAARVRPSGLPGDVGSSNTMIAFEFRSGAAGVRDWLRYANDVGCGDDVVFVDIHDPSTPAVELFVGDDPVQAAARFAAVWDQAMEADVSGRAGGAVVLRPTMTAVMALALAVDKQIATDARLPFGSPMYFAGVLAGVGVGGDAEALRLYGALRTAAEFAERDAGAAGDLFTAASASSTPLGRAVTLGVNLFENMRPSERRESMGPFARRLAGLATADAYFDRSRPKVSWRELIVGHKVVVFNVGPPARAGVASLEAAAGDLTALLVESLRTEVDSPTCQDWQKQGRAVTLYIEELAMAGKRGTGAIKWFRNQGRFAGVRLVLATQDFATIDADLLEVLSGLSTLAFFSLGGSPVALDWVRRYLSTSEPEVWDSQLAGLEIAQCILSTSVGGRLLPRVLVRPDFHADESAVELRRRLWVDG